MLGIMSILVSALTRRTSHRRMRTKENGRFAEKSLDAYMKKDGGYGTDILPKQIRAVGQFIRMELGSRFWLQWLAKIDSVRSGLLMKRSSKNTLKESMLT